MRAPTPNVINAARAISFSMAVLLGLPVLSQAEPQDKPRLAISVSDVSGALNIQGTRVRLRARDVVEALHGDGWCRPDEAPAPRVWYEPPVGVDPNEWVSVTVAEEIEEIGDREGDRDRLFIIPSHISHPWVSS